MLKAQKIKTTGGQFGISAIQVPELKNNQILLLALVGKHSSCSGFEAISDGQIICSCGVNLRNEFQNIHDFVEGILMGGQRF